MCSRIRMSRNEELAGNEGSRVFRLFDMEDDSNSRANRHYEP